MKTWNSSPQQQLSVLPFKIYGQVFWSATNVTYNSIPFRPAVKDLSFLLWQVLRREWRHLFVFKNIYLMYVSKRSVLWIFQSFVTIIFILLYWWTRYLFLGTISWHLQTQHFITSLQCTSEGLKWPATWYF